MLTNIETFIRYINDNKTKTTMQGIIRFKCSTIRISGSRNPIIADYTLKGHTLTTEDHTKYHGVEIAYSTILPSRQVQHNQDIKIEEPYHS